MAHTYFFDVSAVSHAAFNRYLSALTIPQRHSAGVRPAAAQAVTHQPAYRAKLRLAALSLPLLAGGMLFSTALQAAESASAAPDGPTTLGFFGTTLNETRHGSFTEFELYAFRAMPWQYELQGLELRPQLFAGAGFYQQEDDRLEYVTVGPVLQIGHPSSIVSMELGVRPGLLADYQAPHIDFGGHFTFFDHVGLFAGGERWQLGYRYQHMSNANLFPKNPGVEMHIIDFRITLP